MSYMQARARVNYWIDFAGAWLIDRIRQFVVEIGEVANFGIQGIALTFRRPFRVVELIQHLEFIGNKSLFIIALTGLFTGIALSYQIYLGFKTMNATTLVGPTVALGITRELGPVLTGLIMAARAGGAMAARLGTMRVTEQIDALEVMGVDPVQYLVSPRIIAALISAPLLTGVFDAVAILGSYVLCIFHLEMDEAVFISRTSLWLEPYHINEGLFKAAVFGLFFSVICTHRGFNTTGGAAGVGQATNKGVVTSMVMIIVLDFFLTNIINAFYKVFGL